MTENDLREYTEWEKEIKLRHNKTEYEKQRKPPPPIPPPHERPDPMTNAEWSTIVQGINLNKATGEDGIRGESVKYSSSMKNLAEQLTKVVIDTETVPEQSADSLMSGIYKKNDSDLHSNYRLLCMSNICPIQFTSHFIMIRLQRDIGHKIPLCQRGFQPGRGHRDAIMMMRTLVLWIRHKKIDALITFMDWKKAFPSISHNFIQWALHSLGASMKVRGLVAMMYKKAKVRVKVMGSLTDRIPYERGVLEGRKASPLIFIAGLTQILNIAMELIQPVGVDLCGTRIHSSMFADDLAIVDMKSIMQTRLDTLFHVASREADMYPHPDKTFNICPDIIDLPQNPVTEADVRACPLAKHECTNCKRRFFSMQSLSSHYQFCTCAKLRKKQEPKYDVQEVVGARGPPTKREYKIRWVGKDPSEDTWLHTSQLDCKRSIRNYFRTNKLKQNADLGNTSKTRCFVCGWEAQSEDKLKAHDIAHHNFVHRKDTVTWREVQSYRKACVREVNTYTHIGQTNTKTKHVGRYLGSWQASDGSDKYERMTKYGRAKAAFHNIEDTLTAKYLSRGARINSYTTIVCSTLVDGCEGWWLTQKCRRWIRMINARFLVKITNRTHREEIKEPTFHLEHRIIARRLRYLQDILDDVGGQYAEQQTAVRAQLEMRIDGNITTGMEILDNFPKHITWDELCKMRGNEDIWRKLHKHYF